MDGRDLLEVFEDHGKTRHRVIGCHRLMDLVAQLRTRDGDDPKKWQLPEGSSHEVLLVREFILKLNGTWKFPYEDEEICHCRMVPTRVVDQAILAGAHTTEAVTRATSASSACGTCRPDVQSLLNYRLCKTSD